MPLTNGPVPTFAPPALPLVCWDIEDVYSYVPPPQHWYVEGVFPAGSSSLIAAREKTGKTHWLVDLCCSVALGQDFLGRETEQAHVLLVAMEDHARELQSRILTRLDGERPDTFHWLPPRYVGLNDQDLRLEDDSLMRRFTALLLEKEIKLIALDPLRELHDQAENDADAMAPTLRVVRDIAHEHNLAVVTSHHAGRDSDYRGSTAIGGAVDQILAFKRKDHQGDAAWEESTPEGLLRIEGRYGPRQVINMALGDTQRWEVDPTVSTTTRNKNTRAAVVDCMRAHGAELTSKEIASELGKGESTIRRTLKEMEHEEDTNLIVRPGTSTAPNRYRYRSVAEAIAAAQDFLGEGVLNVD